MEQDVARIFECRDPGELDAIASEILGLDELKRIFTLKGQLGAGKTALIKSFCKVLNVREDVTSPTFSILNEYVTGNGDPVYHFDLYRLKSRTELFDFGYEVYFYSGNHCFIEWPEIAGDLIPDDHIAISIEVIGGVRHIKVTL
jgi:tRNA threonylcarbamoyladenosine biosynthesis protein TsaE